MNKKVIIVSVFLFVLVAFFFGIFFQSATIFPLKWYKISNPGLWDSVKAVGWTDGPGIETVDISEIVNPIDIYAQKSLKQYEFPLRAPYLHSGSPLLASGQGVISPINLLFLWLHPVESYGYRIVLLSFLGLLFMYFAARQFQISREASIIASVTFIFSVFSVGWMSNIPFFNTTVLIPLVFGSFYKALVGERFQVPLLVASIGLALQILTGYFPNVASTVFLLSVYVFYRLICYKFTRTNLKGFALLIVLGLGAFVLSAVQLLPSLELSSQTERGEIWFSGNWCGTLNGSLNCILKLISNLLYRWPFFPVDYEHHKYLRLFGVENSAYIGFMSLFFVLYSFLSFFRKDVKKSSQYELVHFSLFLLISMFLVTYTPLGLIFPSSGVIKGFSMAAIAVLLLSLLCGIGIDIFVNKMKDLKNVAL